MSEEKIVSRSDLFESSFSNRQNESESQSESESESGPLNIGNDKSSEYVLPGYDFDFEIVDVDDEIPSTNDVKEDINLDTEHGSSDEKEESSKLEDKDTKGEVAKFRLFSVNDEDKLKGEEDIVIITLNDKNNEDEKFLEEHNKRPDSYYFSKSTAELQSQYQSAAISGDFILDYSKKLVDYASKHKNSYRLIDLDEHNNKIDEQLRKKRTISETKDGEIKLKKKLKRPGKNKRLGMMESSKRKKEQKKQSKKIKERVNRTILNKRSGVTTKVGGYGGIHKKPTRRGGKKGKKAGNDSQLVFRTE
ncbi:unnamed protein product [[Candida] boidinii]|nr:hypothetical protein B5S33_g4778 [[Candida] boidinii]GME96676.1 unnamed protein product [[Candida] boidinii]